MLVYQRVSSKKTLEKKIETKPTTCISSKKICRKRSRNQTSRWHFFAPGGGISAQGSDVGIHQALRLWDATMHQTNVALGDLRLVEPQRKGLRLNGNPSYRHKKNCFSKGDTPRFQKKVLPATALWVFFGHSATLNKTTKKRHIFCVVFRDFQICPVHGGSQNETMDFFHTRGASQVDFTIRFFANLASHLFQWKASGHHGISPYNPIQKLLVTKLSVSWVKICVS